VVGFGGGGHVRGWMYCVTLAGLDRGIFMSCMRYAMESAGCQLHGPTMIMID
jgi:hypothetical protein